MTFTEEKIIQTLSQTMPELVQKVLDTATAQGVRLVTAESCTGGMIATKLTDPAGSSSAFWGGFVVYANEMKQQAVGVNAETLETFGAVSPEVAAEMAAGAVNKSPATLAVSVSGIAGPGGGTDTKPVGLVEFATYAKGDTAAQTDTQTFKGDRAAVRLQATAHALNLLLKRLEDNK